jgi:hypothetical protein
MEYGATDSLEILDESFQVPTCLIAEKPIASPP